MSTSASKAFHTLTPPKLSGQNKVQVDNTSTSATEKAIWTGLSTDAPTGKCMVVFEAMTVDCYIVFKTGTSAATVTTSTGAVIPAGQQRAYWLDPDVETYFEHITAASAGKVKWFVASPDYDGT